MWTTLFPTSNLVVSITYLHIHLCTQIGLNMDQMNKLTKKTTFWGYNPLVKNLIYLHGDEKYKSTY
jgi:hypothetical protein